MSGCGLFSTSSIAPTGGANATVTATSGSTATPGPTARPVKSIVVVAAVGDAGGVAGTPSELAWNGAQQAAATLGATATLVSPRSAIELAGKVEAAAAGGATIVIAVGQEAAADATASSAAHPDTQFFTVEAAAAAGPAPANLHDLVFDEAQAGYLAGVVATAYSQTGHVGMVGDGNTDSRTLNYASGFEAGAREGDPAATVTIGYAGADNSPEKARAATDVLTKGGADVVLAMPGISGIGTMREACARKALVIGADTDAWQLVPDVRSCVVASVRKRYDTAVSAAILGWAAGAPILATTMNDVATGGIGLTDLHVPPPAGLQARLDAVLAVMRATNASPTPTPTAS